MSKIVRRFLVDNNGATSLEYAMIGAFLSILIIAGSRAIGSKLSTNYFWPISNNLS